MIKEFELSVTTQGPLYPPAEVINSAGDFIVLGNLIYPDGIKWGMAIVSKNSLLPKFGHYIPYKIEKDLLNVDKDELSKIELFTLPLPIPLNNYPMVFAPEQFSNANTIRRDSYPLNKGYIYDYRESDGRREIGKITLLNWIKATGKLLITISEDKRKARFDFSFKNLIPNSLYTVMSLRERDLDPKYISRPGPLGIPNVFITDDKGNADYYAILDNPFPKKSEDGNRIINVIVLFMSSQQSYGGAIGHFGLGGDVHAHLKLKNINLFDSLTTY